MPWYNPFEDNSVGPQDIGKPINIDPLATLKDRPKFKSRKQRERAEQYAAALERDATTSTAPLGHWTQVLDQWGKGILGGLEEREIDKDEAARREYMASALEGKMSPEDLMKEGALYDMPEVSEIGQYQERRADRQADVDWRQQQYETGQDWKNKDYQLEKDKFAFQQENVDQGFHELNDGTIVNDKNEVIGSTGDRPPPVPDLKDILKVGDDVKALPTYKTLANSIPIYRSMATAVKDPADTTSGDLLIIHSLAKIFDPTSVVMQGEQEAVKASADLPSKVWGYINYVQGGNQLTPALKREILAAAKMRMDQYQSSYDYSLRQYTGEEGLLKRHNIPSGDVVPTLEPIDVEDKY